MKRAIRAALAISGLGRHTTSRLGISIGAQYGIRPRSPPALPIELALDK
jgi:hypothetical protein